MIEEAAVRDREHHGSHAVDLGRLRRLEEVEERSLNQVFDVVPELRAEESAHGVEVTNDESVTRGAITATPGAQELAILHADRRYPGSAHAC